MKRQPAPAVRSMLSANKPKIKTMKKSSPYNPTIAVGLVVLGGMESFSSAGGFRLPDQDAFATARGEAFVATADNPSAIFYNPAGITQIDGTDFRLGFYGIYLDPSYQNPHTGATYNNQDKLHVIPQVFFTQAIKDTPVTLGLGIYAPFGLGTKWDQTSGFRTVGIEGSLADYCINPVVAVKLPWNISLAAGLMVNYAYTDLEQGLTPLPNNDLFRFKGDAWGLGYNLGGKWDPIKKLSFGVNYRSSSRMDYSGHTETYSNGGPIPALGDTTSGANFNQKLPFDISSGVSFRPTEKWNLEFDADYTDWSELGTLTISQSTPSKLVPLSNVPVGFDWQSSWYYEFGATRYFDNGWHVSAGYIFNESSVPNGHYNPIVADVDKHFLSIGTGYKGKHLYWDLAYQFGFGPDYTVSGSAAPLGYPAAYHPADGTYSFISHAVVASVGWHF